MPSRHSRMSDDLATCWRFRRAELTLCSGSDNSLARGCNRLELRPQSLVTLRSDDPPNPCFTRLRDTDSIVLWIGVGAAEQLLLAWVVHLLKFSGSRAQVSVVQFTRAGKRNMDVWRLGLLNPDQIEHHPPVEQLSSEAIAELE